MKISKIIESEANNLSGITLHKEGVFWRAYEKSAFQLVNSGCKFKIIKKFVKTVNSEIVSVGFPDSSLPKILDRFEPEQIATADKVITIKTSETIDDDIYRVWKNDIPIKPEQSKNVEQAPVFDESRSQGIMNEISNFQVISKTPLECQQFLITIQNQIHGSALRTTGV